MVLFESSTRTFVSAVEGLSETERVRKSLGGETHTFSESALAIEKNLGGSQLADMTRPFAALAENYVRVARETAANDGRLDSGRSSCRHSLGPLAPGTAQFQEEETRLRKTLRLKPLNGRPWKMRRCTADIRRRSIR